MAERRVYRGWLVEEVKAAYRRDAMAAAKRGLVATDGRWVDTIAGMAVLTVTYEYRPDEAAEVSAAIRSVDHAIRRRRARARPVPATTDRLVDILSVLIAFAIIAFVTLALVWSLPQ